LQLFSIFLPVKGILFQNGLVFFAGT